MVQLSRLAAQLLGGVRFNGLPQRTESLPAKKESDSAKKTLIFYSTFGEVHTRERLFRSRTCLYIRVLPGGALGITDKGHTRRLQRALNDFGLERSFNRAIEALQEHYGFALPVSTAAHYTLKHAERIAVQLSERDSSSRLPGQGADCIIAEADGSFVPIVSTGGKHKDRRKNRRVDYQEARLCACQKKGSTETFYEATFEDVDQVGKLWAHSAKRAGRGLNTQIHSLGDGAPGSPCKSGSICNPNATWSIFTTPANTSVPLNRPASTQPVG